MADESREPPGKPDRRRWNAIDERTRDQRIRNMTLRGIQGKPIGPTRLERADSSDAKLYRALKLEVRRQRMEARSQQLIKGDMQIRVDALRVSLAMVADVASTPGHTSCHQFLLVRISKTGLAHPGGHRSRA